MHWTEDTIQAHQFKHHCCCCECVCVFWCRKWNGYFEINCHFNYLTVEKKTGALSHTHRKKIRFGSFVGPFAMNEEAKVNNS